MINLKNIRKTYGVKIILEQLDLELKEGEMIAIVGESGIGKSTLLNILSMLDFDFTGEYFYNDANLKKVSKKKKEKIRISKIATIYQSFYLIDYLTGLENVHLPLIYSQNDNKILALEIMKQLNIDYLANQKVKDMSGGEKQRIAIARALIKNPDIILADEPTGNLDKENSNNVLKILKEINIKYHKTIVVVTHNSSISNYFDKIYKIEDKRLIENHKI